MKNAFVTNIAAALIVFVSTPALAGNGAIGKVMTLTGAAESSSQKGATQVLSVGATFNEGDRIITHADTRLRILLPEKIAMQLGPNAEMTIVHPTPGETRVSLNQGELMSSVHHFSATERPRFEVRTRSASMGVRGTTFFVAETPSKPTFVCICHGTVAVKTQDKETAITSEHHDAPKFVDPEKGTLIAAKAGVDHKDADAAALQKLVE